MFLPFLDQEHLVRTRCGSVTVAVYGDEDRPALVTYPDVGLNCECHHRFYNLLITVMTGFCDHQPHMANMLLFFCWIGQTCHVSKDCSSARKLRLCCSTISASTTSILRGTRSVMPIQPLSCVMLWPCVDSASYMIFVVACVKSPTAGSGSNPIWCAGAICWWSCWSGCRCARFLQVLYRDSWQLTLVPVHGFFTVWSLSIEIIHWIVKGV